MLTAQAESDQKQSEQPQPRTKHQLDLNGYTPKALSELADISISWAFRILDGEYMPGREVLARIADVVGMSMDELNQELLDRQRAA